MRGLTFKLKLICIIIVVGTANPLWAQWDNMIIDTVTNTHIQKQTRPQSLDLDSYGYGHLTWTEAIDGGGHRLFYATNNPLERWDWHEVICDSTRPSFSPALVCSDFYRDPYVVYMHDSEIFLAYRQNFVWYHDQVTDNSQLDEFPTIAYDNDGRVHLAWITDDTLSGEYKIAYAYGQPGGWDIQVLADSYLGDYGTGASPYMGVSADGRAHIVYRGGNYGDYHIHYAWNESAGGSNWEYEIITSGNINDFASCLAFDGDDNLHVAVSGNDGWGFPSKVFYNYKPAGGGWQGPELASTSYSTVQPSLAVDFAGKPHIVSMEVSGNIYTGKILYSYKDNDNYWNTSEVLGNDHFFPSFKISLLGIGHIGLCTGGNSTDYDIYYLSGDLVVSIDDTDSDRSLPRGYCLAQNYPNPFNALTVIKYELPRQSQVTIEIYDLLGKRVVSLIDRQQQAGYHQAIWNAANIPSGLYFYKIQAGDFVETKKMLLLK